MKKFLIINPFGIGDVLFTTPIIEALRKNFPDSVIAYICNNRTYELLNTNPHLNAVYNFDKEDFKREFKKRPFKAICDFINFLKTIKENRFDTAIDFSLGHIYSFFLKFLGVPKRIGFNYKDRGRFLTDKKNITGFNDKHIVEYYFDLLKFLNIEGSPDGLKIFLADEDTKFADEFLDKFNIKKADLLIGVIPGGGASWGLDAVYKQWKKQGFAYLADELIEKHKAKITIFGSKGEGQLCNEVMSLMKNNPICVCGKTNLRQFAALLSRCNLVICNDGGPLHMAAAMGTKTISIFGPVDETVYGPYPLNEKHSVVAAKTDCRPCYKNFKIPSCNTKECLMNILPESVYTAVKKQLESC